MRILFLCDRNTVRSPMAAALVPGAASAGLSPDDAVDPFAVAVMAESGHDIAAHVPAAVEPAALDAGFLVVALSPAAFDAAREWRRNRGFQLDLWELPDIPGHDGPRESILDGYRALRDALKGHIRNRLNF